MTLPLPAGPGRGSSHRPARRPRLRRIVSAGLCAGLVSALLPAVDAQAAPLDRRPTKAAAATGVTASGGGYAGWALRKQSRIRLNAASSTPSGVPGIDVSSYQGNVSWSGWYAKGIRWAYVKATEGTSYTNPYFSQQYTGSYEQGMVRGAYHFARPDATASAAAQAKYFVQHGGGWSADGKTLPGALDIEDNYTDTGGRCWGNTDAQNVAWVKSFLSTYKSLTGRDAVIYSNISFWKDCLGNTTAFSGSSPFWLAYWSSSRPSSSSYPGGWTYDTFWQYSGTGSTDLDVFNGTSARLKVLAGDDAATTTSKNTDTDKDGLTDAQEAKLGTNPKKKDTDGDRLSDKAEITGFSLKGYGTVRPDPLKKDSDGDGLSDYTEVVTGFSVWTSKHYTTLASPNLSDTDGDGLSDAEERSRHLSPRRKDTDRDGLSDKAELAGFRLARYGTVRPNPLRKDSDGDGYSDRTELTSPVIVRVTGKKAYKAYSSPNRKDSDRDGVADRTERRRGTDPVRKDTDRDKTWDNKDRHPLNPKKK